MGNPQTYQQIKSKLGNRRWRLNNLYYIQDKDGKKIKFRMNTAQLALYNSMHYFNVILKARQLGFTTFIMIYFLDACLFNSNHKAAVVAQTQDVAQDLFDNKIRFAYDNLPDEIRAIKFSTKDSVRRLSFSNGSSIVVGTSLRSGTYQKLLVSEYGKISAKTPKNAREVKTGALNTVADGQQIFIESTAEGKKGEFFEVVERARKLRDIGKTLARSEPKFFFFAWHDNPKYATLEGETATITAELEKYFDELEEQGIVLSKQQKYWYILKREQQDDDMEREFPSTPEEAFQGSLKGAYYTKEMKKVRERGQICHVPYNEAHGVHTWWDLGTNDLMSCLFYQKVEGRHHFIDYHESSDEGWSFYQKMLLERGYNYIGHHFPHDGNTRMRGSELFTDKQIAEQCGIRPIDITPRSTDVWHDIRNFCKPVLSNCWFDVTKCHKIILHLDNYARKWSEADSMFTQEELHDEASHGASAFRTFAVNADKIGFGDDKPKKKLTYNW